jgi:hypothetical protein
MRLNYKGLPRTRMLAYYKKFANYKSKRFYNIWPRSVLNPVKQTKSSPTWRNPKSYRKPDPKVSMVQPPFALPLTLEAAKPGACTIKLFKDVIYGFSE